MRKRGVRFFSRRRLTGFVSAATLAGTFACAVWMCCPRPAAALAAAAAKQGARSGASEANFAALMANVDKAFYRFADSTSTVFNNPKVLSSPLTQWLLMFNTAWATTSTAPIAAAGVIGIPLGRAMSATVSSHVTFGAIKFMLAMVAMSKFPAMPRPRRGPALRRHRRHSADPSIRNVNHRSRYSELENDSSILPQALQKRLARSRVTPGSAAVSGNITKRLVVKRNPKFVQRTWLILVTALGGPAAGAVAAAVAHRLGFMVVRAVLMSLLRGSVLGTLVSGSLCYGGAAVSFAVRWSVFQGVFGPLFANLLSPSALMFIFFVNCNVTAVRARLTESSSTGGGKASGRGASPRKGGADPKGEAEGEKDGQDRGKGSSVDDKIK